MLTLKAPVQLHIAQGLTGSMDAFCERIRGNYNILGAHYTPKDLLFLLTAPPELPEELGGMTTLVTQQNQVDVRSVTMDVVNNVVNRILLDGTEQFTYQDQVYITSVLNRLGITDVRQFMQQVRQLRSENESTVQMTKLYRSEVEKVLQRQAEGVAAPVLPIAQQPAEEVSAVQQDPRVTMSLEILQRLNTTSVYETVHSFQRNWTGGANHFHNNEFRLAEQLRFSNAVSLAEIKQQVYQQPQLHLLHHLNRYETGVLLETPRDEEAVLSQAAAAALVTAVDNTVTEVLNRPQLLQEQWVRIENAIWQTAENTVSRFETYHSQYQLPTEAGEPAPQAAWNYYLQELQEYQTLYQQLYPRAAEHGRIIGLPPMTRQQMIHLIRMEEGDDLLQETENNYHITRQNTALQLPQSAPEQPVKRGETPPQQLVFRETEPGRETEILREVRTGETVTRQETTHMLETLRQLRETQKTETVLPETVAAPMTLTPEAAEEELSADIRAEEIGRIDRQSHTLLQTLQQELRRPEAASLERQDVAFVLREVLGTPEAAERVLRELRIPETVRMEHPAEAAQEEDQPGAEPGTRELRETLLRQRQESREREIRRLREILGRQTELPVRTENAVAQALERFRAMQEEVPAAEAIPPMTLTPREAEEAPTDIRAEEIGRIDRQSHTLLQTLQQELRRPEAASLEPQDVPTVLREVLGTPETAEQVLRELHTREAVRMEHPAEAAQEEEVPGAEPGVRELRETLLQRQQETREREIRRLREILGRQTEPEARTAAAVAEALERFRTAQEGAPAREVPRPPMTLTPREAEEQAPDVLVEKISRIDQHNRTLLQTLQQETRSRETPSVTGPDVQRTMRDALRALEEPESILREVYTRQETTMVHPDYTPREESLLRQADPASRAVYEKILAYQRDPEGALARGLIRAASMGSLQAELKRAAQEPPLQLEHPERPGDSETVLLREQSETVLEQFRNRPGQRVRQETPRPTPGAVQFVHKPAAPDVTEELLEQLQQQRTQTTVKTATDETITQQHTHQVDIRQMENKVVTQTTEDITELVNRTLARQMRTISDQVYRQMEKRLQSERSRRGRF